MAKKDEEAPAAAERVEDRAADLELVSRTIRNNPGTSEADARKVIEKLREGGDFEDKRGLWTFDVSNTPVLHPKAETLPEGPQEG